MSRLFTESKLLIASGNQGKINEINGLLSGYPVEILSTAEFDIVEPEETGKTFIENAMLKASYYGKKTGLPALADDSGLSVEILDGAPGIYSARWAGKDKDFSLAFNRLQEKIKVVSEGDNASIKAHFVCALALWWPDGHVETVEGYVFGTLTFPPRGENGFGYDPIFLANGQTQTFAEIPAEQKRAMSHRANAFSKLVDACFIENNKFKKAR